MRKILADFSAVSMRSNASNTSRPTATQPCFSHSTSRCCSRIFTVASAKYVAAGHAVGHETDAVGHDDLHLRVHRPEQPARASRWTVPAYVGERQQAVGVRVQHGLLAGRCAAGRRARQGATGTRTGEGRCHPLEARILVSGQVVGDPCHHDVLLRALRDVPEAGARRRDEKRAPRQFRVVYVGPHLHGVTGPLRACVLLGHVNGYVPGVSLCPSALRDQPCDLSDILEDLFHTRPSELVIRSPFVAVVPRENIVYLPRAIVVTGLAQPGWRKSGIGGADGKHGLEEYLQAHVGYLQYDQGVK